MRLAVTLPAVFLMLRCSFSIRSGVRSAYIVVTDAAEALEFYSKVFGAHSLSRMPGPDGKGTLHAEMVIGDSAVMLADEFPQFNLKSPKSLGGNCATLHLYVEDADAVFAQAVKAGCEVLQPMSDAFWGDRYGKVCRPLRASLGYRNAR